mgnify:CR=1 FL=1
MEKSIEERVKTLELEMYDLKVRTSEHQGFIWRTRENKYRDNLFCIFAAVATVANLVMLVVQILL